MKTKFRTNDYNVILGFNRLLIIYRLVRRRLYWIKNLQSSFFRHVDCECTPPPEPTRMLRVMLLPECKPHNYGDELKIHSRTLATEPTTAVPRKRGITTDNTYQYLTDARHALGSGGLCSGLSARWSCTNHCAKLKSEFHCLSAPYELQINWLTTMIIIWRIQTPHNSVHHHVHDNIFQQRQDLSCQCETWVQEKLCWWTYRHAIGEHMNIAGVLTHRSSSAQHYMPAQQHLPAAAISFVSIWYLILRETLMIDLSSCYRWIHEYFELF